MAVDLLDILSPAPPFTFGIPGIVVLGPYCVHVVDAYQAGSREAETFHAGAVQAHGSKAGAFEAGAYCAGANQAQPFRAGATEAEGACQ